MQLCARITLPLLPLPLSLSLSLSLALWRNSPTRACVSLSEVYRSYKIRLTHPTGPWSAPRRCRYPHNSQQRQETNINALSGIRTRDPGNQEALDLRLGPRGHRDWQLCPRLTPGLIKMRPAGRMQTARDVLAALRHLNSFSNTV
jgi:hypothetical protein